MNNLHYFSEGFEYRERAFLNYIMHEDEPSNGSKYL